LKLANFKKLDKNFSGKGMKDGAKQDREIWKEFFRHRDTLKKEAALIKQLYLTSEIKNLYSQTNFRSEFNFQFHKSRESDPVWVKFKKESALKNKGKLSCEICNVDSFEIYGELGRDLLEIHFAKELKTEPGIESSELDDFIIVCPNCHKILDKFFAVINVSDLRKIVEEK
jgi:5-methylcytosine-specific restriction protein A